MLYILNIDKCLYNLGSFVCHYVIITYIQNTFKEPVQEMEAYEGYTLRYYWPPWNTQSDSAFVLT
jgi:hypothetical protein